MVTKQMVINKGLSVCFPSKTHRINSNKQFSFKEPGLEQDSLTFICQRHVLSLKVCGESSCFEGEQVCQTRGPWAGWYQMVYTK